MSGHVNQDGNWHDIRAVWAKTSGDTARRIIEGWVKTNAGWKVWYFDRNFPHIQKRTVTSYGTPDSGDLYTATIYFSLSSHGGVIVLNQDGFFSSSRLRLNPIISADEWLPEGNPSDWQVRAIGVSGNTGHITGEQLNVWLSFSEGSRLWTYSTSTQLVARTATIRFEFKLATDPDDHVVYSSPNQRLVLDNRR